MDGMRRVDSGLGALDAKLFWFERGTDARAVIRQLWHWPLKKSGAWLHGVVSRNVQMMLYHVFIT